MFQSCLLNQRFAIGGGWGNDVFPYDVAIILLSTISGSSYPELCFLHSMPMQSVLLECTVACKLKSVPLAKSGGPRGPWLPHEDSGEQRLSWMKCSSIGIGRNVAAFGVGSHFMGRC